MNPDFLDIIRALLDAEARFIIVGAYAVNIYVEPRATGDLDILVEATAENAPKVISALKEFGAPLTGLSESDFASPGVTLQIGIPPRRNGVDQEQAGYGAPKGSCRFGCARELIMNIFDVHPERSGEPSRTEQPKNARMVERPSGLWIIPRGSRLECHAAAAPSRRSRAARRKNLRRGSAEDRTDPANH